MKQFYMMLREAYKLYVNRENIAYFYGAKGEVMTDALMNALIAAYPSFYSKYSEKQIDKFKDFARGKIGFDCSGFISAVSGIYGNSTMIYDSCPKKTSIEAGKAGSFLFKRGASVNHCGLDIGYGYCMHCPGMGKTLEIAKIQSVGFTNSGELYGYDYTEAKNY